MVNKPQKNRDDHALKDNSNAKANNHSNIHTTLKGLVFHN